MGWRKASFKLSFIFEQRQEKYPFEQLMHMRVSGYKLKLFNKEEEIERFPIYLVWQCRDGKPLRKVDKKYIFHMSKMTF